MSPLSLIDLADADRALVVALAVAVQESDIRDVKALIVGPADSPYQFGFFEVSLSIYRSVPRCKSKAD